MSEKHYPCDDYEHNPIGNPCPDYGSSDCPKSPGFESTPCCVTRKDLRDIARFAFDGKGVNTDNPQCSNAPLRHVGTRCGEIGGENEHHTTDQPSEA